MEYFGKIYRNLSQKCYEGTLKFDVFIASLPPTHFRAVRRELQEELSRRAVLRVTGNV